MAAADDVVAEPVIASSNRALDIEPYIKYLFAENPKLWGQVLPWEFPQDASREEEESFIRRFFSEREICMQGGADGDGKGFRFLKNVWYCAALWNLNHRLPAIVDWWFAQADNKTLIDAPGFSFDLFLAREAQAHTFFDQQEIDVYGEKILYWAVKHIQARLKMQHPSVDTRTATCFAAGSTQNSQELNIEIPTPSTQKPVGVNQTPIVAPPPSLAVPPATISTQHAPTWNPVDAAFSRPDHLQLPQLGGVSNGSHTALEQRQPYSNRRRGPHASKRNSINSARSNLRERGSKDSRISPTQLGAYAVPGQPMPYAARAPSHMPMGGHCISPMEPMAPLSQGQQFQNPDQPPGLRRPGSSAYTQPYQPGQLLMSSYPIYPTGNVPPPGLPNNTYHNMQHPFADRSNGQGDGCHLGADGPLDGFGDRQFQRKQRQGSMGSRGIKSRGFGSARGRGARHRDSISHSNAGNVIDIRSFGSSEPSKSSVAATPFFTPDGGDTKPYKQTWRGSNRDENSVVYRGGDARRYAAAHERPDQDCGLQCPSFASEDSLTPSAFDEQSAPSVTTMSHVRRWSVAPLCQAGCDKQNLGSGCTTARKVIIFGVPYDMPRARLEQFLEHQYGKIVHVGSSMPGWQETRTRAWVTFNDISSVQKILACKQNVWPDLKADCALTAELAREHFDAPHHARMAAGQARHTALVQPFVTTPAASPTAVPSRDIPRNPQNEQIPPRDPAQFTPPNIALDSSIGNHSNKSTHQLPQAMCDMVSRGIASGDTTPLASGQNTPNKKKRPKTKKKKPIRQGNNVSNDGASGRREEQPLNSVEPSSRNDSVIASHVGDDDAAPNVDDDSTAAKAISTRTQAGSTSGSSANAQNGNRIAEATERTAKLVADIDAQDVVNETVAKLDDEHADETFYTAKGSPALDDTLCKDDQVKSSSASVAPPPGANSSDAMTSSLGGDVAVAVAMTNACDETKKVPAIASLTPKAKHSTDMVPSLGPGGDDSLHAHTQRGVSSGSEATFETAPQTPLTPEPLLESKKSHLKIKGPSQTESLSAYSNKRQSKPKKAGSRGGSIKGRPQKPTSLDTVDDEDNIIDDQRIELRSVDNERFSACNLVGADQAACRSTVQKQVCTNEARNAVKEVETASLAGVSVTEELKTTDETPTENVDANQIELVLAEAKQVKTSEAEKDVNETVSGRRPTLIAKLSGLFSSMSPASPPVQSALENSAAALENDEQNASGAESNDHAEDALEETEAALGLGITSEQGNNGGMNDEKNRRKRQSNRKVDAEVNTNDPLVVNLEKPGYSSEGSVNTAGADKPTEATVRDAPRSSSVNRIVASKDMQRSRSNLVGPCPSRRKHKRVVSSKNSVNSHDSADENALTGQSEAHDEDVSIVGRCFYVVSESAEQEQGKPWLKMVLRVTAPESGDTPTSPEVEAAKARMEALQLREAQIKKEKAARTANVK